MLNVANYGENIAVGSSAHLLILNHTHTHSHTHTHTFLFSFNVNVTRKGIYMDGHERPDVILSRGKFSDLFHYWRERSVKFDDETLEATNLDAKYIMASLDQKAHHSNDIIKR